MVFIVILIDLEMPRDKFMHPTKSKDREWRNPRFPTGSPKITHYLKLMRYHGFYIENIYCHLP